MDPKQLAEEIIENLFAQQHDEDDLYEEKDEDESEEDEDESEDESYEDEDESEEEESDESEQESEDDSEESYDDDQDTQEAPKGNLGASLSMKPSFASGQLPTGGVPSAGNDLESDAHGGTAHDAMGKGFELGTKQTVGYAPGQAAATLNMKPSFAQQSAPSMQKEELEKDVRIMFGGDEDLSEEFVSKAASLYEAAVVTKVQQIAESLRYELAEQFEEKIMDVKSVLEEQLDTYLNYVVSEWVSDNELAIDNGLRTEIAENFIGKLKNLFVESYIEVPEEKTNAFDELAEAVSHLENRLNEEIETNANLIKTIKSLKADQIFMESTTNLTNLQAEQIRSLAENVQFESEQDYRTKINVLVEGVVKTSNRKPLLESKKQQKPLFERVVLEEETDVSDEPAVSGSMQVYYDALNRIVQK